MEASESQHDGGPTSASETMSLAALKAMSNPLRQRILREVQRAGSARAADIAQHLRIPANKVSFHLRVLADAGFIEEAAELARDRRDRVWRPTHQEGVLGSPESPTPDPALAATMVTTMTAQYRELLERIVRWAPQYYSGADTTVRGALSNVQVRLTVEEFSELLDAVFAAVEPYRRRHDGEQGADIRLWDIVLMASRDSDE